MGKTIDADKLHEALRAIITNSLANSYAVERVAFGFEKPGDVVPIKLFSEHLRSDIERTDVGGEFIDGNGLTIRDKPRAEFVRELFVSQTERIFSDAPKNVRSIRADDELPLLPRFREYLFGLLPLFTEVLNTEVEYDAFDLIPTNNNNRATEYFEWKKFVTAILLKPLRAGSQINRYVKNISYAPQFVRKLFEKKGNNFYLKPVDIYSREYAFALFSLMRFMNAENNKLFELKMLECDKSIPRSE